VEGVHFVNGPWFTVQKSGAWNTLGTFRLSNGSSTMRATLKLKVELIAPGDQTENKPSLPNSSNSSTSIAPSK
jgi:hypothetical protein